MTNLNLTLNPLFLLTKGGCIYFDIANHDIFVRNSSFLRNAADQASFSNMIFQTYSILIIFFFY